MNSTFLQLVFNLVNYRYYCYKDITTIIILAKINIALWFLKNITNLFTRSNILLWYHFRDNIITICTISTTSTISIYFHFFKSIVSFLKYFLFELFIDFSKKVFEISQMLEFSKEKDIVKIWIFEFKLNSTWIQLKHLEFN